MRAAPVLLPALCLVLLGAGDAATGTVLVRSTTIGARVFVDDHEVGAIPMRLPLVLRAGQHTVKVSRPGYADYLDTFRLAPGQDLILEIDLLPAAGVLRVGASVPGAVVLVDGRPLGDAPFEGEVDPGTRVVELRAPGHAPLRRTVELVAGEVTAIDATLVPLPTAAPTAAADAEAPAPWYGRWYVWAGAAAVVAGGVAIAVAVSEDDRPRDPEHVLTIQAVP